MATKRPTRTLAAAAFLGLDQQAARRPVKKARISAPARASPSPSPDRESASPSPPRSRIPRSLISGGTTIKTSRLNVVKKSRTPVMEIDEILDTFHDDEEEEEEEEQRVQVPTIRQAPNTRFLGNLLQHTMNHNERVLTMANLTAADDDDIVVEDPLAHEDEGEHGTFRYQPKKVITRQQQKDAEEEENVPRTRVVRGRGGVTLSGGSDVTDNYLHKHLFDKTRIAKLSAKQRRMKGVALLHSIAKLYHIDISIKPVVVNNSDVDGPITKKETDRLRISVDNGITSTVNKKRKRMIDFDGIGGDEEQVVEEEEQEEETQEEATEEAVDEVTEEQPTEETEPTEPATATATETNTETPAPTLTRKPSASTSTPTLTRKTSGTRLTPKPAVLDRAAIREAFLAAKRKKENGGVTPKAATAPTMTFDTPDTTTTTKTSTKATSTPDATTSTTTTAATDADAADLSWLEQKRLKAQAFAKQRAARLAAQESKSQTETETPVTTTPTSTSTGTSTSTKKASTAATPTTPDTPSTTKSSTSTSAPRRTTSSTSSTTCTPSTSSTDKKRPRRSGGLFAALSGLGQR